MGETLLLALCVALLVGAAVYSPQAALRYAWLVIPGLFGLALAGRALEAWRRRARLKKFRDGQ